uniref:Ig-like domain-containing protein n=1 Tax=Poecilia latipinna TaxID=48699 RepID=A0A3B3VD05_9TELE
MQFVSAAGEIQLFNVVKLYLQSCLIQPSRADILHVLNNATIKAEPGENVVLTCKDPDQGKIKIAEWKRTDLGSSEYVLLYKDDQLDPGAQHPSYRDRVDLLCNQIMKGDVSLLLKNTTTDDSGTYECRIDTEKLEGKLISTVSLQVSPPPPPGESLSLDQNQQLEIFWYFSKLFLISIFL